MISTIEEVQAALEQEINGDPNNVDSPIFAIGSKTMSLRDVYNEVKNRTTEGVKFAERWIKLQKKSK